MNDFPEKNATILISDMVGFTKKTLSMTPKELFQFLLDYRKRIEQSLMREGNRAQYVEHGNGDATASVFEDRDDENKNRNIRAFKACLHILKKIQEKKISNTRFGLYSGKVIVADINNEPYRFGNCFSAAARLRELCDFFDRPILMDRDVALAQSDDDRKYIACLGKITPKSFDHPIHVFTTYKPGLHKVPISVNENRLFKYIALKNRCIDYFNGNNSKGIRPNFSKARNTFYKASVLFKEITGHHDLSSERMLEFIEENHSPAIRFLEDGVKMGNKDGLITRRMKSHRLGRELLKALDKDIYKNIIFETRWQKCFHFQYREKGERVIEAGDSPDGVYFIIKGVVNVINQNNNLICQLRQGGIFGEMAYFSEQRVRNASVIANTDLELYFIPEQDFIQNPEINNLFERISRYRGHTYYSLNSAG